MKITQINVIRRLTKKEYFQLRKRCFFSNCLYNFGLYNVRQKYFKDNTFLCYTKNEKLCKENDNYKLLQANMSLTISSNSINVKDGYLVLPASRTYSKVLNDHKIKIKFPERLIVKKIKELKIIPSTTADILRSRTVTKWTRKI